MNTMRQIAQAIDNLDPPTSLRALAGRFRHDGVPFGNLSAGKISLRDLQGRVAGPNVKPIRLLHFNCWLIEANPGVKELLEFQLSWADLLAGLGINLTDALVRILDQYGVDPVCDVLFPSIQLPCGIEADPLNWGCKKATHATLDLARFLLDVAGKTIDEIVYIFNIPNNFIFDALGLKKIRMHPAPELDDRASEIGHAVKDAYDVMSLVEVWTPESVRRVLNAGGPDASVEQTYAGRYFTGPKRPPGSWQNKDSGLLVFVPSLGVTDGGNERFQNDGLVTHGKDMGPLLDTDRWAAKGVQLTRIDTGVGVIDLYSTHLYSGGDPILPMENLPSWIPVPEWMKEGVTDDSRAQVQRDQIVQLCKFIAHTRDEAHQVVVAGDFNVPGRFGIDPAVGTERDARYQFLLDRMGELGLDDWWSMAPFRELAEHYGRGGVTNRHGDGDAPIIYRFDPICKPYDIYRYSHLPDYTPFSKKTLGLPQPSDGDDYCDYFCNDAENSDPGSDPNLGNRIDYIFIERPSPKHACRVEVTRLRRRAFRRRDSQWKTTPERADNEGWSQVHLSDHLGLEVTLFARATR